MRGAVANVTARQRTSWSASSAPSRPSKAGTRRSGCAGWSRSGGRCSASRRSGVATGQAVVERRCAKAPRSERSRWSPATTAATWMAWSIDQAIQVAAVVAGDHRDLSDLGAFAQRRSTTAWPVATPDLREALHRPPLLDHPAQPDRRVPALLGREGAELALQLVRWRAVTFATAPLMGGDGTPGGAFAAVPRPPMRYSNPRAHAIN